MATLNLRFPYQCCNTRRGDLRTNGWYMDDSFVFAITLEKSAGGRVAVAFGMNRSKNSSTATGPMNLFLKSSDINFHNSYTFVAVDGVKPSIFRVREAVLHGRQ